MSVEQDLADAIKIGDERLINAVRGRIAAHSVTRDQLIADIIEAKKYGLPTAQLEGHLASYPTESTFGNYAGNVLGGVGGRVIEGIAGLTGIPAVEDYSGRLNAINEYKPGSGLGSFAVDAAAGLALAPVAAAAAPAIAATVPFMSGGMKAATLANMLAGGLYEGATHPGTISKRAGNAATGAALTGVGELVGMGGRFLAKPVTNVNTPMQQELVDKALSMGIPLDAADRTGSQTLQYLKYALDFLPSSAGLMGKFRNAKKSAWSREFLKNAGEDTDLGAVPSVMRSINDRTSSAYDDIFANNDVVLDQEFYDRMAQIKSKLDLNQLDFNRAQSVKNHLDEFQQSIPIPSGGGLVPGAMGPGRIAGEAIPGELYQSTRSMLADRIVDAPSYERGFLKQIKGAFQDAAHRNLPADVLDKLAQTDKQYATQKFAEKNVNAFGELQPNKLLADMMKRDRLRVVRGTGDQDLTDLAKIGALLVQPQRTTSGTAQINAAIDMMRPQISQNLNLTSLIKTLPIAAVNMLGIPLGIPKATAWAMNKQGPSYLTEGLSPGIQNFIGDARTQALINALGRVPANNNNR